MNNFYKIRSTFNLPLKVTGYIIDETFIKEYDTNLIKISLKVNKTPILTIVQFKNSNSKRLYFRFARKYEYDVFGNIKRIIDYKYDRQWIGYYETLYKYTVSHSNKNPGKTTIITKNLTDKDFEFQYVEDIYHREGGRKNIVTRKQILDFQKFKKNTL